VTLGGLLASAALAGCPALDRRYVAAERATHDAVAPEYRQYVEQDPALSAEQQARRQRTLEAWAARLDEAERGLGQEDPHE
jgi:hypothetical protein